MTEEPNECKLYKGRPFTVTIDRGRMQRRYVLQTIDENREFHPQNEPMYFDEFREHYGFSEEWPHEFI